MSREPWRNDAACKDHPDPDIFFPDNPTGRPGIGRANNTANAALELCQACPVRSPCLAFALSQGMAYRDGIYGGLTARQRARLLGVRHQ